MHIAFFNPQGNFDNKDSYWTEHPDFGGQLVYVKELALALNRLGHETILFTRQIKDPGWPEFQSEEEHYKGTGVKIVRIPFGGNAFLHKEDLWPHLPQYVEGVKQWYREAGMMPDIVTTHYGDGGVAGAMFQEMTGVPYAFTAHSLGAQKLDKLLNQGKPFAELDKQYKFTLRLAAERIAIGQALLRVVSTAQERDHQYRHRLYNDIFKSTPEKPFAVVPPGANRHIFSETATDMDAHVEKAFTRVMHRDIDQKRQHLPMTIASSRLDAKKNVTGLVEAYGHNQAWQAKSNLMLAVRGLDDPEKDFHHLKPEEQAQMKKIFRIMEEDDLAGKVTFINLGSQEALAAAYRTVARHKGIFCLTSLYEPFGLATIEAMSCGLPVVVTQNGGGSEILKDQEDTFGVLIDPEDPDSIATGALTLLSNEKTWAEYQQKGLARVKTTYTWEAAAKGYQTAINEAFEKRNLNKPKGSTGINTNEMTYLMNPIDEHKHLLKSVEKRIEAYINSERSQEP